MRYSSGFDSDHTNVEPAIQFRDGSEDREGETGIDNLLHHIVIANARGVIGFMESFGGGGVTEGNKFHNITAYNCEYFISHMQSSNTDNEFVNCTVSDMDDDHYSLTVTDNFTYTYTNFYNNTSFNFIDTSDPTNTANNPLFTNPGADDYTLQSGSDLIDAGTDLGYGHLGSAPDQGALEKE
jgi:hypothetical protein